ncbi:MAG TPA: PEP-CTERM sorting domain-containing protein [Oculatellaceae cyanobacterium]|jgi:hypothetical protein
MKVLSVLALGSACSISLSLLAKVAPAFAVNENNNNNSFETRQIISGDNTVDAVLDPGLVDFFSFSNLTAGKLFDIKVNSDQVDSLLALLDIDNTLNNGYKLNVFNDDKSDVSVLSQLTGKVPDTGILDFGVSGANDLTAVGEPVVDPVTGIVISRDYQLGGAHNESGSYTLSLNTFDLPQASTNSKLINGGFEQGDFSGWATLGETNIDNQQSNFGSGPTEGNFQALLSTADGSFNNSILEEFLGLGQGALDALLPIPLPPRTAISQPPQGSAIQQKFAAKAGQRLTFDWNFLTNEVAGTDLGAALPDFSFVSINSEANSISKLNFLGLAAVFDPTNNPFKPTATTFFQETGFNTFSYKIPTDGIYSLGIGVSNKFDNDVDSALLVDNVQVVPEPSSLLSLLGFGVLGAGSLLKRKQRQKAGLVKSS